MNKKPESCPFCGSEQSYMSESHSIFSRICENCGAEGPLCDSASWATRKWNRRAKENQK